MQFINRMRGKSATVFLIVCILAGSTAYAGDAKPGGNTDTFTFAIVPQQSASKLAKLWGPILDYLGKHSGYKLEFKTAKNIPVFEQRLEKGLYDFAYMNPYHYTVFQAKSGYRALAKAKGKRIKGIMVVRKDSPVSTLEGLAGQELAFPSPAAFAASILTRKEFQRRGLEIKPRYVSSHDSVYRNVANGRMSAGGGVMRTLNNVAPEVKDQLRVLWKTPGFTPHAIAAHPRVSHEVAQKIQAAMLSMDSTEEGRRLLASIRIKGLVKAQDPDWNDVRALNITLLQ